MVLSGEPREKKSPVTPSGIDPGTDRLIAQRLNRYATPGPLLTSLLLLLCEAVQYGTKITMTLKVKAARPTISKPRPIPEDTILGL